MQSKKNESPAPAKTEHKATMSSIEISEISGKSHNDVLKAIRKMETAWKKVTEGNFSLSEYSDKSGRKLPMFELTKRECLYVATKFNDEARARLIIRWDELEQYQAAPQLAQRASIPIDEVYSCKMGDTMTDCYYTGGVIYTRFSKLLTYLVGNISGTPVALREKLGVENFIERPIHRQPIQFGNQQAFERFCIITNKKPSSHKYRTVLHDVFGVLTEDDQSTDDFYTYKFTDKEIKNIYLEIAKAPISKPKVIALIESGNQEGGRV